MPGTLAAFAFFLLALTGAARAGDPAEGQRVFARRCAVCHMIQTPDGETIVRGNRTGPNQYGIMGRQAGTVPGFDRYGPALVAAGEAGLVWTEAEMARYLEDPAGYLQTLLGDRRARSRMIFRLRDAEERADVAAYLATMN
jgi:cytochrome c